MREQDTLTLTETATELRYQGKLENAGFSMVVEKTTDGSLVIHMTVPAAVNTLTWDELRAELADRTVETR